MPNDAVLESFCSSSACRRPVQQGSGKIGNKVEPIVTMSSATIPVVEETVFEALWPYKRQGEKQNRWGGGGTTQKTVEPHRETKENSHRAIVFGAVLRCTGKFPFSAFNKTFKCSVKVI